MPAHSDTFPWLSYYGGYNFFEARMMEHSRVKNFDVEGESLYGITRDINDFIRVFICECYSYGVAEYWETVEKVGEINAIIISGTWCGYTDDLKIQCRDKKIGLFSIKDFMAALNHRDYWNYLEKWEADRFAKNGWI